jgi:glycerol uptake facilitator-like aquaporin
LLRAGLLQLMPAPEPIGLTRRLASEAIGTAFLLAAIVGSGIMGEQLAGGNTAIALLANTVATGAALVTLILTFGPISGAHFNPLVTMLAAVRGDGSWREMPAYLVAQCTGAVVGVVAAHSMFSLPLLAASTHERAGTGQIEAEAIATLGLLAVIVLCARFRSSAVPFAVAGYITSAYWFTSSTSFANPAVALARSMTNTFAGIRPSDVPGFLVGQMVGLIAAAALLQWLAPPVPKGHR